MIEQLREVTVNQIAKRLVLIRAAGGAVTLGRVLTLVIRATEQGLETALKASLEASKEHPMRIIAVVENRGMNDVVSRGPLRSADGLDAELRIGEEVGASEIIILRPRGEVASNIPNLVSSLLLSDTPLVHWWFDVWPDADSNIRRTALRQITDSSAHPGRGRHHLMLLSENYREGDTDLAWARITLWRAQLAALLDNLSHSTVRAVTVSGTPDSPSTLLLAAWLRLQLGVRVKTVEMPFDTSVAWGLHSVTLEFDNGTAAVIARSHGPFASITQPYHPVLEVPLPRRPLSECLIEDLRMLRHDQLFAAVITKGLPLLIAESEES